VASGEIMLSAADYLAYMVEDPRAGFGRGSGIRNVPQFRGGIPRAGRSWANRSWCCRSAAARRDSATSAIAGHWRRAATCRRRSCAAGAIVVSNMDDLVETIVLLSAWNGKAPSSCGRCSCDIRGDCS
jgi:hypothetical protein